MLAFIVAAIIAAAGGVPGVIVVDDAGAPVAAAQVTFSAPNAPPDVETTDRDGVAVPRAGFAATQAIVDAPGFERAIVRIAGSERARVVLQRAPQVIGAVRVATGSQQSLHRLPVPASVLDATAIASSPATTSDALLRALPGFDRDRSNSAFTNYGQLRVSFSGAGNDRGVVLADGLPAQDAFGGQVDWSALPSGNVARAELLRGAGSALYGSGAVGGVLQLDTRGPAAAPRAPADGSIALGGGGLGASDASLFYRAPLGAKLAASLWSSTTREAYYDFPVGFRSKVDQIARSQSDATELRVRTVGGASAFELSGLFSTDAQAQGRENYDFGRTLRQLAVSYSHAGARAATTVQEYARESTVINVADQFPTAPGVLRYVQHVPSWENGVFASWLAPGEHLDLEARGDVRAVHGISDQRGGDGTLQSLGSGAQSLAGVALQARVHASRFEALLGARYDDVAFKDGVLVNVSKGVATTTDATARTDAAVSPRAAVRYDLSPNVALRASSGGGFRAPFLNELVRGFQIGSVVMAPNPALVPERSRGDGIGIDVASRTSRLAFDLTKTRVNDAIAFVTLSPVLQQRRNVAHTATDGAAVTYATLLGPCTRLRASGQTQYARVTDGPAAIVGKRLAYVPDREATVGIDAQGGLARYGVDASFLGAAFADDTNTQPLGSALLIGARVTAPLANGATLTFSAENLTNRLYLSSQDRLGPPASVMLRLAIPLGARTTVVPTCSAL
ncbi:MAG TPA: TonB-dependent receptor [Candidatus Elarobacter sp.]|jgi:outer membrane receptor protein involved in Fe transport|nr:TonB-dependent receptor [Candidatus Elarobacter sp.]